MVNKKDLLTYQIQYLSRILRRNADKETLTYGLTVEQGRTILYLYWHKNEVIHLTDLQKEFKLRKSSLTSLINNLEKNGYVVRIVEDSDQRQKRLKLTNLGMEKVQKLLKIFDDEESTVRNSLTNEEANELNRLLSKIMIAIENL